MIEIGGNQRARDLVKMVDEVEHPNWAPTSFCWVINDTWGRALSRWNTTPFRFVISRRFCPTAVFNSSN